MSTPAAVSGLADQVERGKISRTWIAKTYGKPVAADVRKLLRERDEARRAAFVPDGIEDDDDDLEDLPVCDNCEQTAAYAEELTTGSDGRERCEPCHNSYVADEWMVDTRNLVEQLCERHGWHINYDGGGFNTTSVYFEIWREVGEDVESFRLRISDHGSAYCREDISLAMRPSGDDHTIEILERRLQRPANADHD